MLVALCCLVGIPPEAGLARAQNDAAPGRAASSTSGYDISYPQCNGPFPSDAAFAIVGVNGGRPFSVNPCLGAGDGPSELAWAGINAGLYANTANPGPTLSSHWPSGQNAPKECNTASNPGADTAACAYDYGWDAAADSYRNAVLAYQSLGWASPSAMTTPVSIEWWLDVETENSWRPDASRNVAVLQGAVDYLMSVGAAGVGFYSAPAQWAQITGGTTAFAAHPSWVAGAASLEQAQSACAGSSGRQLASLSPQE